MKKCVQCTKDLPDAALHCVFCGSKQPVQAPAEVARTVMGYSANQVREQLAAQGAAVPPAPAAAPTAAAPIAPPPRPHPASAPPPMNLGFAATAPSPVLAAPLAPSHPAPPPYQPPMAQPPMAQPSMSGPSGSPPPFHAAGNGAGNGAGFQPPPYQPAAPQSSAPAFPPPVASSAATLFVPNQHAAPPQLPSNSGPANPYGHAGPASHPSPGVSNPMASTVAVPAPVLNSAPMSGPAGYNPVPVQPSYVPPPSSSPYQPPSFVAPGGYQAGPLGAPQSPPYLASLTADRPIDPYRDSLRLVLFAFGILLVGAFCTPLSSAPAFHWDAITADVPVSAKIPSLLIAVTGLLSVVIAAIPMSSPPRGLLAVLIALLAIVTPIALAKGVGDWHAIVTLVAPFLLVPGLLVRQEYQEEFLPRLMVTLAVLATLALWLVPVAGSLPLVATVKQVVDASGTGKVAPLLALVHMVIVVLTLLVWLPAPASGGAKLFAWILIFWPAVLHFQGLLLSDDVAGRIKGAPFESAMIWALPVAYAAIFGYGLAALIGKRYESA